MSGARATWRGALAAATVGLLLGSLFAAVPADAEPGRSFYLSPDGNDAADGRSEATAWKTLARAGQERFIAGDQILLRGGAQFDGRLTLDRDDVGTADLPITITSYGTGRPTIRAAGTEGIQVYNTGGVEVRGLDLVGDPAAYGVAGGITFYTDQAVPGRLPRIAVSDVEASKFKYGVLVMSAAVGRGYDGVSITGSRLHDNRDSGLLTLGPDFDATKPSYAFSDVKVSGVTAYDNLGDPANAENHTGSGIILGSVDGGTIEESSAYGNGALCPAVKEGPVGIWTYDSDRVTIQRNVSYRNRSGGAADGGGFDLDQNVSNSVIQYNLSYENAGPGLMLFTAQQNGAHRGNTVRFNISVDDVRGPGQYGGLYLAGRVSDAAIHHNTIVTRGDGSRRPSAAKLLDGLDGVALENNILLSQGAGAAIESAEFPGEKVRLQGNAYHRQGGGGSPFEWGETPYATLSELREATGQERTSDGGNTGIDEDPKLQSGSASPTVTDPRRITAVTQFALAGDSPAGGAGVDLGRTTRSSGGSVDYFGATLGGSRPVSIGAAQPATVSDGSGAEAPAAGRTWLWVVALVLLVLVGGSGLVLAVRGRRRPPPPPGSPSPPETLVVPSSRGDGTR